MSGGLWRGINCEGFSRKPAHTDVIGNMSARLSVCNRTRRTLRYPFAGQRATPGLDGIDCLQPARKSQVLDCLHSQAHILVERFGIFVEADKVRGVLRELHIPSARDAHRLLGIGDHLLRIEVDGSRLRSENLVLSPDARAPFLASFVEHGSGLFSVDRIARSKAVARRRRGLRRPDRSSPPAVRTPSIRRPTAWRRR